MPEQRNSFSLPYSLDAEKAVLGSVLRNPDILNLIIDKVDADAFFQDSHRHIYQAMREQGLRKADLARRLTWHAPQIDRLFDLKHASRVDQMDAAFAAIGRRLEIGLGETV